MRTGRRIWRWARASALFACSAALCFRVVGLEQQAYVWQRAWTEAVNKSVLEHGTNFTRFVVLAAEVSWKQQKPVLARIAPNYALLKSLHAAPGVALRIGPYTGSYSSDDEAAIYLKHLAASLLAEARSNGVAPAELQLDFDCAESKLAGYRIWVGALRSAIAPIPLTITALPSWLASRDFEPLVRATDGYILQVHSLERPRDAQSPFSLCDPVEAKRAVTTASRIRVPFLVALPTYGYRLQFDRRGQLAGLSAEGDRRTPLVGSVEHSIRSNPTAMADLVAEWSGAPPRSMRGIIWYRLPVETDDLNWCWVTLESVMNGRRPEPKLTIESRKPEPGLVELDILNKGSADADGSVQITASGPSEQSGFRFPASDALPPFEARQAGGKTIFETRSIHLAAGDRKMAGWLRFSPTTEVHLALHFEGAR